MKRLFAIVVAMMAMTAFFTSCDEENFVINHHVVDKTDSLTYEVWCDQSNALTTYSVKWLILRSNGSMQFYNCSIYKDNEGEAACRIEPSYGKWSLKDNYVTLEITESETLGTSTVALRYDDLDGRSVLRPVEATSDIEYFDFANSSRQATKDAEMWKDIMTLFKHSRNVEDNLDIATEYVIRTALQGQENQ